MKRKQAAGQLTLFKPESPRHEISVEPVPYRLSLRPDLFKIVIYARYANGRIERFPLPIQWTRRETVLLMSEIRGITWQLGENNRPLKEEAIADICKDFIRYRLLGEYD